MERAKGYFFALASAMLLGLMAVLIKIVMDMGLSLIGAIFFRFSIAALFLALFLLGRGASFRLGKMQFLLLGVVAVVGYGVMNLCYYGAFRLISVGLTSMIHYIYPVVAVLLSRLLYQTTVSKNTYGALLLAVIGAMVLSFSDFGNINPSGVLLALGAGVCYGFYAAFMEHPLLKTLPGTVVVFYLSLFTAVFALCLSPFFGELPWASATPKTVALMVVIALLCTVLALFLFRGAIVTIGTVPTTILSTMEPVSSAVLGILFLGEGVDIGMILGSVMILFAVIRITMEKNRISGALSKNSADNI